jgi:hypothetical protein
MNDNNTMLYKKQFATVVFIMICIMVFEQIIYLTIFIYEYNTAFFEGKLLNNVCNGAYTEFETHRFQVNKNIENIKIRNDLSSDDYSSLLLYVMIIITFIYVLLIFLQSYANHYMIDLQKFDIDDFISNFFKMNFADKIISIIHFISCIYLLQNISIMIYENVQNKGSEKLAYEDLNLFVILLTGFYMIYKDYMKISYFAFIVLFICLTKMMTFMHKPKEDETKPIESKANNAIVDYIIDIFGKKRNDKYSVVIQMILEVLSTLVFSLFILYTLYLLRETNIIHFQENFFVFSKEKQDKDFVFNLIFPIILLFIVSLIVSSSKKFNDYVNVHILQNPFLTYKHHINDISGVFDMMVENNRSNISNNSHCKNIANAVHMVLYSSLFVNTKSHIIPELEYESSCENNDNITYNTLPQYNPETYFDKIELFADTTKKNCLYIDNAHLKQFISNIYTNINMQKRLFFAIQNIKQNKVYYGGTNIILSDNFIHNNPIRDISKIDDDNDVVNTDVNFYIDEIDKSFSHFVDNFKHLTTRMVRRLKKCRGDDYDETIIPTLTQINDAIDIYDGEFSNKIKITYVRRVKMMMSQLFSSANDVLSSNTSKINDNNKLSKFVINNYNMVHDKYDKYRKKELIEFNYKKINDNMKYYAIDDILDEIFDLHDIATTEDPTTTDSTTTDSTTTDSTTTDSTTTDSTITTLKGSINAKVQEFLSKYQYTSNELTKTQIIYMTQHNDNIKTNLTNKKILTKRFYEIEKYFDDEIEKMNKTETKSIRKINEDEARQTALRAKESSITIYILLCIYIFAFYTANRLR